MEIETLYLVKDKIKVLDWFDVKVEILTYDDISSIKLIKKFKNMDSIDFLKNIAKVYEIREYTNIIILYEKTEKEGFINPIGAFRKENELDYNSSDLTLDEFIKRKNELRMIYFNKIKIDMENY